MDHAAVLRTRTRKCNSWRENSTRRLSDTASPWWDDHITPQVETRDDILVASLVAALQTVRGALDRGRTEEVLQGVSHGISANLMEALASMSPGDFRAILQVGVSWSRNRPRLPSRLPNRVAFAHSEFPIVRETGRRLRESIEPRRERVPVQGIRCQGRHGLRTEVVPVLDSLARR